MRRRRRQQHQSKPKFNEPAKQWRMQNAKSTSQGGFIERRRRDCSRVLHAPPTHKLRPKRVRPPPTTTADIRHTARDWLVAVWVQVRFGRRFVVLLQYNFVSDDCFATLKRDCSRKAPSLRRKIANYLLRAMVIRAAAAAAPSIEGRVANEQRDAPLQNAQFSLRWLLQPISISNLNLQQVVGGVNVDTLVKQKQAKSRRS